MPHGRKKGIRHFVVKLTTVYFGEFKPSKAGHRKQRVQRAIGEEKPGGHELGPF